MKKITIILLSFTLLITLSGCLNQEEYDPVSDVLDSLNVTSQAYEDFELIVVQNNVELSWTSNNPSIKIEGNKALVTQGKNDVNVTLVVEASKGDLSASKEYNVNVIKDVTFPDTVSMNSLNTVAEYSYVLLEEVTAIQSSNFGTYFTDGTNVIYSDLKNIDINKTYDLKGMKITSGVIILQNCSVVELVASPKTLLPTETSISNIVNDNGYFNVTGTLIIEDDNLYIQDNSSKLSLICENTSTLKMFEGYEVSINVFVRGEDTVFTYANELELGLSNTIVLNVIKDNLSLVEHTKNNINIPTSLLSSTISWTSSNSSVLSTSGIVNRQNTNTTVKLTATLKLNSITVTKDFNIVVVDILNNYLDELFISEYYQGTGNNKAIEIYNPTDYTIDLAEYSTKQAPNGDDFTASSFVLSGQLKPNESIVIANSSGVELISYLNENNITYLINGYTFTGNDCVGLFLDGELVDIFGVLKSSDNFIIPGYDVPTSGTVPRRVLRNITTGATTTWNNQEWYATAVSSSNMLFENLGKHSFV